MNEASTPHALPLGQLIDRIFRLFWAHLRVFVGIAFPPITLTLFLLLAEAAVVLVPILSHLPASPNPGLIFTAGVPLFVLQAAVSLIIFAIYFAAGSHAAMEANLGGRPTIGGAYRIARERARHYVLLASLCYAVCFLPMLLLELALFGIGATFASSHAAPGIGTFAFFVLTMLLVQVALVYGVVMALRLSLAVPACVAEGLMARAAMRRSVQLTRGSMGRIFLVLLVVYAATYLLILVVEAMGFAGVSVFLFAIGPSHFHSLTPSMWVGIGFAGLLLFFALALCTALTWAGIATALGVIYHDQRYHLEGVWPAAVVTGGAA